jgi:hypothetical protein
VTRRYRTARPEEHRALVVQDAQAFGEATTTASIDRSMARTPLEELRVLEEDGVTLGLLLARSHRVYWGGRPVPAGQVSGLSIGAEHRGRGAARHLPVGWPDGYRARPVPAGDDPAPPAGAFRGGRVRAQRPGRAGRRLVAPLPAQGPRQRAAPGLPGRRPGRSRRLGDLQGAGRGLRPRGARQRPDHRLGRPQRGRLAVAAVAGGRLLVAGGDRGVEGTRPGAARPAPARAGHPSGAPVPLDGQGGRRARRVRGPRLPVGPAGPGHRRRLRRRLPLGRRHLDDRGGRRRGQGGPGR